MYQPVQDGIGQGRIAQVIMPMSHRQLAGNYGGAAIVAILKQFQQVPPLVSGERRQPPIIADEDIGFGEVEQEFTVAAIAFGEG